MWPPLEVFTVKFVCQELVRYPYQILTFVGSELNHAPIACAVLALVPKIQQIISVSFSEADENAVAGLMEA